MSVAKDHWKLELFFYLLFDKFVGTKLERLIKPCWCTMIRVAERAFKLAFDYKFFVLTFNHKCFNALTTGILIAANQVNRLSIFEIEEVLAKGTLEV